jgi:endonuclease-3
MSDVEIGRLIRPSTFHEQKARQIREIARIAADREGTDLTCSRDEVLALPGVGPKCANLALGIACGLPLIAVDIHVHRVVNRWGYVRANSPERTMDALSGVLPERRRVEINRLLVPFGKNICTGIRPKCSTCPVRPECRQVGVVGMPVGFVVETADDPLEELPGFGHDVAEAIEVDEDLQQLRST